MHLTEIPLLIFTILGQMSVGAFLALGVVNVVGRTRWPVAAIERISDIAVYAVGVTLILGFAGSFLHLGNPMNAMNAMNHLTSSGMSREILAGVLFAVVGGVYALCQYFRWLTPFVRQVLAAITAILGIVLVAAMASLYLLPTVPAWNTWETPASFFATTGLLGCMAVATALIVRLRVRRSKDDEMGDELTGMVISTLTWLLIAAMVMLAFIVLITVAQLASLNAESSRAAQTSLAVMTEYAGLWVLLRIGLSLIGIALLGYALYRLRSTRGQAKGTAWGWMLQFVIVAFICVFAGEVIGRELFYSAYARLGM
ncbi:dimethyl sulfoxide reductase anchor subunit family protein [Devriesea agamarum]|uniref:dimethyl sulfoxide reductase anchor subunit family protein n=1 Tax=Devriesea agamarum TaxID=472569 RepID=UPI00071C5088|nr:DmsC/YnfH family molybdoenzyme membrane anchor subunit [Devriesea agamarum]